LILTNSQAVADGSNLTIGDPTPFGESLPSPVVADGTTADVRTLARNFDVGDFGRTEQLSARFDRDQSIAGSTMVTPVPEPSTLGLMIIAMAATTTICRRKLRGKRSAKCQQYLHDIVWR
jgi:hypothetical protein